MTQWNSLYLPSADTQGITDVLKNALIAPDYELYDPFGLMPGKAYATAIKLFIAPPQTIAGDLAWTRLVIDASAMPDARVMEALSQVAPCLSVTLDPDQATTTVYQDGAVVDTVEGLSAYADRDAIKAALSLQGGDENADEQLPMVILSDELQNMAEDFKPNQIEKMMNKFSNRILSPEQQKAAQDMVKGQVINWNSEGGRRIATLMRTLGIHAWREPDYVKLRDAYQLLKRRERKPDARLYPGDQEAMDAVPDALSYTPIFAGVLA